jgi:hypothetical protein
MQYDNIYNIPQMQTSFSTDIFCVGVMYSGE